MSAVAVFEPCLKIPARGTQGLHWPFLVFIGLCCPSLASVGIYWPSLARGQIGLSEVGLYLTEYSKSWETWIHHKPMIRTTILWILRPISVDCFRLFFFSKWQAWYCRFLQLGRIGSRHLSCSPWLLQGVFGCHIDAKRW